jgi:hypothetical protein
VAPVAFALTGNLGGEPAAGSAAPWVVYVTAGLIFLAIACEAIYIRWMIERGEKGRGNSSDDDGGGGGGIGRGQDLIPPKGSPGADPEWWPEFERQFAAQVGAQSKVHAEAHPANPARDLMA